MKHVSVRAGFLLFSFLFPFFFRCKGVPVSEPRRVFCNAASASTSSASSARDVMVRAVAKAVPAVATTVGVVNMFRAAYRWVTGKPQGSKNRSFAGNECHCKDPDLCWVKRHKGNEIKKLYETFLHAQNNGPLYTGMSESQKAWMDLGFNKLSEDAQRLLQEKFCAIEDERKRQSFQRAMQQQERERKEKQAKQEKTQKTSCPDAVQNHFVQHADEIRQYGQNLISSNARQQKRLDAIHEALENGFRASYKRYNLAEGANTLLGKYGIDASAFQECTGNAIQQQTHAEFVDVLNSGTDFLLSDKSFSFKGLAVPGEAHKVSEDWFSTLGHFSLLGTKGSAAGYYSLAHELSDLCQGIYDVVRATISSFQNFYELDAERLSDMARQSFAFMKKAYHSPRKVCEDVIDVLTESAALLTDFGKWAEGFLRGVIHKAFVRPLQQLVQLSAHTRSNPEVIREMINRLLCAMAKSVYKGCLLLLSLEDDPSSERTQQCAQEFHKGCLAPLCAGFSTVAQEFEALSEQEKMQEIAAMVVQWVTINGLGKLANLAVQEGQLAQLAHLIKLAEQGTPAFEAGLGGGGALALSLPIGQEVATGVAAGFEVATKVGATGVLAASRIPLPSNDGPGFGGPKKGWQKTRTK